MPLLAAVLVVNHRHGTTETHAVPLADPPLWPIIAKKAGEALRALRSRLGQPTRPGTRRHRAHPGLYQSRRVGGDRSVDAVEVLPVSAKN